MTMSQSDKARHFRALHEAPRAFVIANPWDAGSARVLAGLGFPALATSSGAKAGVLGKRDGKVTRDEALANARMIVEATDLPVSADLEKCFGDAPAVVAETAPSRTPPARRIGPSTTSARPPSAWRPQYRRRARCRSRSC
jgi:2-methylisocitrate lyase-like PEP mutase family enzyme